jgi:hypothetical protein
MTRFMQYMSRPMPTRTMRKTWSLHRWWRTASGGTREGSSVGRGSSLYHAIARSDAHGSGDVKKLSKHSESAAAHAQIRPTSKSVCASLCDVRQSPSGRPKYSSCGGPGQWGRQHVPAGRLT